MTAGLRWWFARGEGALIEYVSLPQLKREIERGVPIFGAERDGVRAGFDRYLVGRRKVGPFFRESLKGGRTCTFVRRPNGELVQMSPTP